jgi:WD40 repeat protein
VVVITTLLFTTLFLVAAASATVVPAAAMRDLNGAATATDNLLKIWDTKSGALLHSLEHGPADWEPDAVLFSPDGALVVSAEEHAVKLWDPATVAW